MADGETTTVYRVDYYSDINQNVVFFSVSRNKNKKIFFSSCEGDF